MKDEIKNIISGYCQGKHYLEFCVDDFDKMIAEIKEAVLNQIDDSEHLDDARNNVKNYL
jgi:hypothetical protein